MNEYYKKMFEELFRFGYIPVKSNENIYLQKEQEEQILLLHLIPERLPGQNPVDLNKEAEIMQQIARRIMIASGKPVESLLIQILTENPQIKDFSYLTKNSKDGDVSNLAKNSELCEESQDIEHINVWFANRETGRIFIYENQVTDFYGLEAKMEEIMSSWFDYASQKKKLQIKKAFTPVNTVLILINLAVFLLLSFFGDSNDAEFISRHGAMAYDLISVNHEYYRIFTSMFLHFGYEHLMHNMFTLFIIGPILERNIGKVAYIITYIGAGVISSLTSYYFTLQAEPYTVSAGASGAICGIMGALFFLILANLLTRGKKEIEGISLRGIIFIILFSVGYGFTVNGVDNAAHIGGLIGGFLIIMGIEGVRMIMARRK